MDPDMCIFCYKSASAIGSYVNVKEGHIYTFINCLERLLGQEIGGNKGSEFSLLHYEFMGCCNDCFITIKSFCEVYHQMRCLELQLEWKLQTLIEVMRLASKVPSRLQQLRILCDRHVSGNQDGSREKELKGFRQNVIRKCTNRLLKSQPRVLIKDCSAKTVMDSKSFGFSFQTTPPALVEMFLGWIMSFSAVAILATAPVTVETSSDAFSGHGEMHDDQEFACEDDEGINESKLRRAEFAERDDMNNQEAPARQGDDEYFIISIACQSKVDGEIFNEDINSNVDVQISEPEPLEIPSVYDDPDETNFSSSKMEVPDENEPEQKVCAAESLSRSDIVKTETTFLSKQSFPCPKCTKTYKYKHCPSRHVRTHHPNEISCTRVQTKKGKFRCSLCDLHFTRFDLLRTHKLGSFRHKFLLKQCWKQHQKSQKYLSMCNIPNTTAVIGGSEKSRISQEGGIYEEENAISKVIKRKGETVKAMVRPYHLRENRTINYLKLLEPDKDERVNINVSSDSDESSSESDSSSIEDESSSDDGEEDMSKSSSATKNGGGLRNKYGSLDWVCRLDGCNKRRIRSNNPQYFLEHQKLHKSGQYKCQFCEVVEVNVIKLSNHELNIHSQIGRKVSGRNVFCCPRCDVAYFMVDEYQHHFGNIHISSDGDDKDIQKGIHVKHCGNAVYICPIAECSKTFKTAGNLENHKKLHGTFKCQFCDVVKEYAPNLALHETEHAMRVETADTSSSKKYFNCSRCSLSFELESWYIQHHMKKHLNLTNTCFTCPICKAEGWSNKFMSDHMKKMHEIDKLDPSQILRCDQCPAYFVKGRQLTIHKFSVHYNRECSECDKPFREMKLLVAHLDTKHPHLNAFANLKFSCDVESCTRRFANKADLEKHKISSSEHANDLMICSECGKEFKGKYYLSAHMKNVHVDPSHICPQCGKTFKTKLILQFHMEYHKTPDQWKFQCSTCGKKVVDKQKLEQHMRTHTKEKPYKCPFCGKGLAHQHNWKNHLKTQHKEECDKQPDIFRVRKVDSKNRLSRKGSKKGDCLIAEVKQK